MNGLHINLSEPYRQSHNGEYKIEDFNILTTVISALKWKEKNGKIKLCADKYAIDLYDRLGILCIYDKVELLNINPEINPNIYWAGAKIFALKQQTAPVAVIDNDFIVWNSIPFDLLGDCTVIHFEELYPDVYPPLDFFKLKSGFTLPEFDYTLPACNTAFYVLKSKKLLDLYTDTAISFMENTPNADDTLKYMVFAEQRLLSMCAKKIGAEIKAFSDLKQLFNNNSDFTHIWGMKQQMRENKALRQSYCNRCISRIRRDFPQFNDMLNNLISFL